MNHPIEIKRATVVGTGILGTQIAMQAAYFGNEVRIYDPDEGSFGRALDNLGPMAKRAKGKSAIPWEAWEETAMKVKPAPDLEEAVKGVDLIVEAIPENLELKREIFQKIDVLAPPNAILATNSSSIPISRLESATGRPERCLNLHFYFPLLGTNMVDVMGGTRTAPEVMEAGKGWVRSIGCVPLTVKKEILGFCFNRVWRAVKRETLHMWANGFVDFRDVDRAWMIFSGMNRGPFGLMDRVGLDVVYDIEMVYFNESKDPKDRPPDALKAMIERGELGAKNGKGFYTYPNPEYSRPDFMKG